MGQISTGNHFPDGFNPFLVPQYFSPKKIVFDVTFDNDWDYTLGGGDQADWNKLWGLNFAPLINSGRHEVVMLGWRYDPVKEVIEITPYYHLAGLNIGTVDDRVFGNTILEVDYKSGTKLRYEIEVNYDEQFYIVKVVDLITLKGINEKQPFSHSFTDPYENSIYFGGNNTAPKDFLFSKSSQLMAINKTFGILQVDSLTDLNSLTGNYPLNHSLFSLLGATNLPYRYNGTSWIPILQNLTLNGTEISISEGNTIDIGSLFTSQTLSLVGDRLSISGGNFVDFSYFIDSDYDNVNNTLNFRNSAGTLLDSVDLTPLLTKALTEGQTLRISGTNLQLIDADGITVDSQVDITTILNDLSAFTDGIGSTVAVTDPNTNAFRVGNLSLNTGISTSKLNVRGGSNIDKLLITGDNYLANNEAIIIENSGVRTTISSYPTVTHIGNETLHDVAFKRNNQIKLWLRSDTVDVEWPLKLNSVTASPSATGKLVLIKDNVTNIVEEISVGDLLTSTGTGGENNVQSDWAETNSALDSFILNKPTLFSGSYTDLTNIPSFTLTGSTLNFGTRSIDLSPINTDSQNLSFTGTTLTISNGNSVNLASLLDNTDAQTLSLVGSNLSISGGNTVALSSLGADNLGNHTATQNLNMGSFWVSPNGTSNVGVQTSAIETVISPSLKVDNLNGGNGSATEIKVGSNGKIPVVRWIDTSTFPQGGFIIGRQGTGSNGYTYMNHRGNGSLRLNALEGSISLEQAGAARLFINSTGVQIPVAPTQPNLTNKLILIKDSTTNYIEAITAANLSTAIGGGGGTADNLGNHIATQNLDMGSFWVSADGTDHKGVQVGATETTISPKLIVNDTSTTAFTLADIIVGGTNRGARISWVDSTTYPDGGFRIWRGGAGPHASTFMEHRGNGSLIIQAAEGSIELKQNNALRVGIDATGVTLPVTPVRTDLTNKIILIKDSTTNYVESISGANLATSLGAADTNWFTQNLSLSAARTHQGNSNNFYFFGLNDYIVRSSGNASELRLNTTNAKLTFQSASGVADVYTNSTENGMSRLEIGTGSTVIKNTSTVVTLEAATLSATSQINLSDTTLEVDIPTKSAGVGSVLTLTNASTGEAEWQAPSGGGGGTFSPTTLQLKTDWDSFAPNPASPLGVISSAAPSPTLIPGFYTQGVRASTIVPAEYNGKTLSEYKSTFHRPTDMGLSYVLSVYSGTGTLKGSVSITLNNSQTYGNYIKYNVNNIVLTQDISSANIVLNTDDVIQIQIDINFNSATPTAYTPSYSADGNGDTAWVRLLPSNVSSLVTVV